MKSNAAGDVQPEKSAQLEAVPNGAVKPFKPNDYPDGGRVSERPEPTTTSGFQTIQHEPALQTNVSIQLNALELHVDDCIKLVTANLQTHKAEIEGKIELLRTEISELRTKRQEKSSRRWDTRVLLLGIVVTIVLTTLINTYWGTFWEWITRP